VARQVDNIAVIRSMFNSHLGQIWDNHNRLVKTLRSACLRTDQPVAALLDDLKQRGLLDSTLVVFSYLFSC
jgi:Protein of unknown function (DUF1501)